jgi:hypothetical protein
MGDDRIGGHVWKFVSAGLYQPGRPESRALFSEGTLYVARFKEDGTGEWRPVLLDTPPTPRAQPTTRPAIPAGARRLGDVYESLGAALMDAYRAANAIGGTPSGRPRTRYTDGRQRVRRLHGVERPPWPVAQRPRRGLAARGARRRSGGAPFRWSRFSVGGPPDPARTGHVFTSPTTS